MNQSLTKIEPNLLPQLYTSGGSINLPMPFAQEIFLLECRIAGTTYRADIAEIEPSLEIGANLRLRREAENKFDAQAITVYDAENNLLGYIPRDKNEILARLLDAGKHLAAKLAAKEWQDKWLKLDIEVFLYD